MKGSYASTADDSKLLLLLLQIPLSFTWSYWLLTIAHFCCLHFDNDNLFLWGGITPKDETSSLKLLRILLFLLISRDLQQNLAALILSIIVLHKMTSQAQIQGKPQQLFVQ
jgi:hypothetical protein